jgi:uncharacterized protein (DUF2267 family)
MSATGLDVFDKTIQTTNTWLDDIMAELGPDRRVAWHVLSGVLHALRDWLPLELVVHLGAQLPLLVRGIYYDQWRLSAGADHGRSLEEFLERVGEDLRNIRPVDRVDATRVVFHLLSRHLSEGQVANVRDALPQEVRALWSPATRRAGA